MPGQRDWLAFEGNSGRKRLNSGLLSHSQSNLYKESEIKLTNHHRAMDDVSATVELLKLINSKRSAVSVE